MKLFLKLFSILIFGALLFMAGVMFSDNNAKMHSQTQLDKHNKGQIEFCDLSEKSKLELCPMFRTSQKVKDGATFTMYQCNQIEMFIEVRNPTEVSKGLLLKRLMLIKVGKLDIQFVCDRKDNITVKLIRM